MGQGADAGTDTTLVRLAAAIELWLRGVLGFHTAAATWQAHRLQLTMRAVTALRHPASLLTVLCSYVSCVLQASATSALAFSLGAGLPLAAGAFIAEHMLRVYIVTAAATGGLLLFGAVGAWLGGASKFKGAMRVLIGGWLAMAITYGIGTVFNVPA